MRPVILWSLDLAQSLIKRMSVGFISPILSSTRGKSELFEIHAKQHAQLWTHITFALFIMTRWITELCDGQTLIILRSGHWLSSLYLRIFFINLPQPDSSSHWFQTCAGSWHISASLHYHASNNWSHICANQHIEVLRKMAINQLYY